MTDNNAALANDTLREIDSEQVEDLFFSVMHLDDLTDALHTVINALPEFGEPMSGRKKTALHGINASFCQIVARMSVILSDLEQDQPENHKLN